MKLQAAGLGALVLLGCAGHGSGFGQGSDGGTSCGAFDCNEGDAQLGTGEGGVSGVCDPNPANFDIPGNNCDDDDNGVVDDPPGLCDTGLAENGPASAMAAALGLCTGNKPAIADATHWGVVSATYTKGYATTAPPGSPNQHGILPSFGSKVVPRQGASFGVLSSGWATAYDQCDSPTGPFKGGCPMDPSDSGSSAPPGYPKPVGSCTPATDVHDASALVLTIKVPANAKGMSFDFDFFSGEWPEWVCTTFNDSFVAWLESSSFSGKAGDLNISYDTNGNPINVNNAFFQACSPANATVGCLGNPSVDACKLGNAELQGSGFYDPGNNCGQSDSGGGSTSWLTTKAPVTGGETLTLQLIIWDTGDQAYDSSVLLDDWQWQAGQTSVSTTPVN